MHPAGDTGVVITMAGASSRFTQAGYRQPKYEIEVHRRSLFAWSMQSLRCFIDAGCRFTFLARNLPGVERFVESQCEVLGIAVNAIRTIDAVTDGQATTAMMAGSAWDDTTRPVAIYNIDTYVNPSALSLSAIRGNGWIPCFPGEGDKWSFASADRDGKVSQVREKKRISPYATVGLYWFDSFERYAEAYRDYYADPHHLEARERYIAPLYNQLIDDGGDVYLHLIDSQDVHGLGTPEDVEAFAKRPHPGLTAAAKGQ
jgi:hypothetical protein